VRRLALLVVVAFCATLSWRAAAHDFLPGVLGLVETAPGRFAMRLSQPVDARAEPAAVRVVFPPHCVGERELDCGARGLDGAIAIDGLGPSLRMVVMVRFLDGRSFEEVVTGPEARVDVARAPSRLRWLWIGASHVLTGFDHLAFLLGLMLLSRIDRRLLLTVTAFTVAHSATLALSVLDVVRLPAAPVEATIAASVVLVARESLTDRPTWSKRAPWAVAAIFGLVHGLGFAGAVRALGLPSGDVGGTLLLFNLGVELGQLAVIVVVMVGVWLAGRRGSRWRRPLAHLLGGLGVWWFVARVSGLG
jgi:hydrogenase/urease accessory protein HupE